jgi:Heparinase II/III-like protein/Heparinase II/III N-terminus
MRSAFDDRNSPQPKSSTGLWLRLLPYFGFVAVVTLIWAPEFLHYYVRVPSLDKEMVEKSRHEPAQGILREIARIRTLHVPPGTVDRHQAVTEGDAALRGEYVTVDGASVKFSWPFDPHDLETGPADWMLAMAAFGIPDRLLKAFDATGTAEYLEKAVAFVLQWEEFEEAEWLPHGLSWNDHAIAERVYVTTDLWRAYRSSPLYDPSRGEKILRLAQRSAELLARPSHFTFGTNHGVMQNLALMQVALAMPILPDAARYFAIGKDRLVRQLAFYISPEGAILEHSAGYHLFGMQLLAVARRYFELAGESPPDALIADFDKGRQFTTALTRPGGSLPLIGDTHAILPAGRPVPGSGTEIAESLTPIGTPAPPEPCAVLPISGYAVWWNGLGRWPAEQRFSQLVTTWSYFPGHAHKHADELSVLLWAAGQDWLSNVGYWAYDHPARAKAESWEGSNAPHAEGEAAHVERTSVLKGSACGNSIAALDLERTTRQGLRVRRQFIQASESIWLVIDSAQDALARSIITDWTFFPGLELRSGTLANSFRAMPVQNDFVLDSIFAGSDGLRIRQVNGSSEPFAGWVYAGAGPVPAPGLIIEQRKGPSWTAAVWMLQRSPAAFALARAPIVVWHHAEAWEVLLELSTGPLHIVRDQAKIRFSTGHTLELAASTPEDILEQAKIVTAFNATQKMYPRYRDLIRYRYRATYAALALCLLQFGILLVARRLGPANARQMRWTACLGWLLFGLWLDLYYFMV